MLLQALRGGKGYHCFASRVDVVYGTAPTGDNSDLLIILAPYVRPGRFYFESEKNYPLYRLIRDSEIRKGRQHAVIITQLWMWNRYLRAEAELAQKEVG
jgi:hypothetical protein